LVAFISPISAVTEVPARPANSRAVRTGPSSRNSDFPTSRLTWSEAPNCSRALMACRERTMPTKKPQIMMITSERAPIR
jgi:hypothetical protein